MSDPSTPINEALIKSYFNHPDRAFGLAALVSLFDFHRRQTQRAEDLSRAYFAQMTKATVELQALKSGFTPSPRSERKTANPSPAEGDRTASSRSEDPGSKPAKPTKPRIPGLNISI